MRMGNCHPFVPMNRRARMLLDEVKPAVEPVSTGALAEKDLVPFASPGEGKAYWQQVSHLISRSWAREVRGIRRAPSSETVKVRSRCFPTVAPS